MEVEMANSEQAPANPTPAVGGGLQGDPNLTVEKASELVAQVRTTALDMFPGKDLAFDLLYKPRLQRAMRDRYRLQ